MGTRPEPSISEWKESRDSHSRRTFCGNCAKGIKVSEHSLLQKEQGLSSNWSYRPWWLCIDLCTKPVALLNDTQDASKMQHMPFTLIGAGVASYSWKEAQPGTPQPHIAPFVAIPLPGFLWEQYRSSLKKRILLDFHKWPLLAQRMHDFRA